MKPKTPNRSKLRLLTSFLNQQSFEWTLKASMCHKNSLSGKLPCNAIGHGHGLFFMSSNSTKQKAEVSWDVKRWLPSWPRQPLVKSTANRKVTKDDSRVKAERTRKKGRDKLKHSSGNLSRVRRPNFYYRPSVTLDDQRFCSYGKSSYVTTKTFIAAIETCWTPEGGKRLKMGSVYRLNLRAK